MILGPLKPRASGERNIRPAGDVLRLRPDEDDEARDTMPPPPSATAGQERPLGWDTGRGAVVGAHDRTARHDDAAHNGARLARRLDR